MFENFSIMNNTPFHFVIAGLTLLTFLWAVFTKDEAMKARLRTVLMWLFVFVLLTGIYIWFIVPITAWVVIKSLGGLVLFWTMLQLIQKPKTVWLWVLLVVVAACGLTLAFFFI